MGEFEGRSPLGGGDGEALPPPNAPKAPGGVKSTLGEGVGDQLPGKLGIPESQNPEIRISGIPKPGNPDFRVFPENPEIRISGF